MGKEVPVLEVAMMIESQNSIDLPSWQRLGHVAEDLGHAALYRSDHFTNLTGPNLDALELWASLTWLADNTLRIESGPLVKSTKRAGFLEKPAL